MKLHIEHGIMYRDGCVYCRVEAGNGKSYIPIGYSPLEVQVATEHGGIPMLYSQRHGWIGGLSGCDIVVGRVLGRNGLIPCLDVQKHLVGVCTQLADHQQHVGLEVQA